MEGSEQIIQNDFPESLDHDQLKSLASVNHAQLMLTPVNCMPCLVDGSKGDGLSSRKN